MNLRDALICGYYDEETGTDYIVEINTDKLKEWFIQENLDLLSFETDMTRKIAVYNILEEQLTKDIDKYSNFTVKFM